jgi:hypothetical protein
MRRALIAAGLLVSVVLAPARAFSAWGLGANLGLSILNPSEIGVPNATVVGVPAQSTAFMPGLRFSMTEGTMVHEAYVDLGYFGESSEGDHFHTMRLGGNYQYNFKGTSARPFLTAGVGIFNVGSGAGGPHATTFTFGGGAGVGFPVSDNAGRLRLEARVDKIREGRSNGEIVIGETTAIQVLFGFDLWVR